MAENERSNQERRKIGEKIRENIQKITLVVISIVYISQGLFSITKRDSSVLEILGNIGLSVLVGVLISSTLLSMGLKDGRRSEAFVNSMVAFAEAKNKATKYFDKIYSWCSYKNALELEAAKKEIIQSAGLSWKGYKFGFYKVHQENCSQEQKQALDKANKCRIEELRAEELLSDTQKGKRKSKSKFGLNEKEYSATNGATDLVMRLATGVVCGLFMLVPAFSDEVFARMMWNALQILMWLTFGILKYENARYFIENDYRQSHVIQKTEYINEFRITMETNPSVVVNFDDEPEVDQFILDYMEKMKKEENENGKKPKSNDGDAGSEEINQEATSH